jgi:hypothetical protein
MDAEECRQICLFIKECNQLWNSIATAFTESLSECLRNPQTNLFQVFFNDTSYAEMDGCCFFHFYVFCVWYFKRSCLGNFYTFYEKYLNDGCLL